MASGSWKQVNLPSGFIALWQDNAPDDAPPRAYQNAEGMTALVGRENLGTYDDPDPRWHISLRHGDPGLDGRVPTWEELVAAAHELRPGICFVVGIPPRSWWMNVHPHVLHLYETGDLNLVNQWRAERQGHVPS